MKIIIEANRHSMAKSLDWIAYFDDLHPDGPVGYGETKLEALKTLQWMSEDRSELEVAVEKKLKEMEGA